MSSPVKRNALLPRLEIYIVDVRPMTGGEVEQYWIDGRSRKAAMRAAARFAGVGIDQVLRAALYAA